MNEQPTPHPRLNALISSSLGEMLYSLRLMRSERNFKVGNILIMKESSAVICCKWSQQRVSFLLYSMGQ